MNLFFFFFKIFSFQLLLYQNIKSSKDIKEKGRILSNNNQHSLNNLIYIENIDDRVTYITSFKKYNNTIYITTNSKNTNCKKRLIYIINENDNNYFYDYKIMDIDKIIRELYAKIAELEEQKKAFDHKVEKLEADIRMLIYELLKKDRVIMGDLKKAGK